MSDPANQIKQNKEKIIHIWMERSLAEVPSASTGVPLALRNSVPVYLDHLAEALEKNRKTDPKSVFDHDVESVRIGKMHGADRASNRSYHLKEVIFEYHILREVIFQILETAGPLTAIQRDIILDSIEQAVNDAAVEFSDIHADIQQKFINTLTHDLKTPIATAKMGAELIFQENELPMPVKNLAGIVMGNLNRLITMIHDLLDASRIRAGEQLSLQFIDCDLRTIILEVVEGMTLTHGNRFILDAKLPIKGNWAADGLRRAIENLIGNAVKYGTPQTPITVVLTSQKTSIEVSIHNFGSIISEEEIPLLFNQYQRAGNALLSGQTGWGLGLTLVKGVVDSHKGKIRVESAEGIGTRFTIEIPYAEPQLIEGIPQ